MVRETGLVPIAGSEHASEVGAKIRAAREAQGMSLRALARALDVSPGHISQVERGIVSPSVGLLYAIVSQLNLSMDVLFGDEHSPNLGRGDTPIQKTPNEEQFVTRYQERKTIDLQTGVRWELLTPSPRDEVDMREIVYQPGGGSSTKNNEFLRHRGREYGLVLQGVLQVQLEFEEFTLGPGDTIVFDSSVPHRMWNEGTEQVRAIWVTLTGEHGEPCRIDDA